MVGKARREGPMPAVPDMHRFWFGRVLRRLPPKNPLFTGEPDTMRGTESFRRVRRSTPMLLFVLPLVFGYRNTFLSTVLRLGVAPFGAGC